MRLGQRALLNLYASCGRGVFLCCAVAGPALSSQPGRLIVTEGRDIGYATVADARATLEAQGLAAVPGMNGNVSFVEPDNTVAWTFPGKDDPAYPSAVRYVYSMRGEVLRAEVTILCEAPAGRCEKFRNEIRDSLAQLSKKMAGDPSAKCRVIDKTMTCGAEAQTN